MKPEKAAIIAHYAYLVSMLRSRKDFLDMCNCYGVSEDRLAKMHAESALNMAELMEAESNLKKAMETT